MIIQNTSNQLNSYKVKGQGKNPCHHTIWKGTFNVSYSFIWNKKTLIRTKTLYLQR